VTTLVRDGLELRYEVLGGSGPALLLPHLNFSWPDYLDLSPFTERYTVITASPRGFAKSSRLDTDIPYRVTDLAADLVAVVEEVGFDRFVVVGYSFTGAFAPWLAQLTGKADAVVSGGFPIAGDYAFTSTPKSNVRVKLRRPTLRLGPRRRDLRQPSRARLLP
jgi:Predicted hydrolases or acyltransferases (alpha/beta hydrolase superfamily)